jgi:hypothetical protein
MATLTNETSLPFSRIGASSHHCSHIIGATSTATLHDEPSYCDCCLLHNSCSPITIDLHLCWVHAFDCAKDRATKAVHLELSTKAKLSKLLALSDIGQESASF